MPTHTMQVTRTVGGVQFTGTLSATQGTTPELTWQEMIRIVTTELTVLGYKVVPLERAV